MLIPLLLFLLFITLEGLFALSEIALISTDRLILETKSKNNLLAKVALKLLNNPERLFTTTIMGITLSIAGNSIFTSYFLISSLGIVGIYLSFLIPIATFLFGQALPKVMGKLYTQQIVLFVGPIIYFFSYFFYPIYIINKRLIKIFLREKEENIIPFANFREIFLSFIKFEEEIDSKERDLIKNIFEFTKKRVYQVMIPISQVKGLTINATVEDAIKFINEFAFSNIPIYQEDITKIIGVVKSQKLLNFKNWPKKNLKDLMINPLYIPENIKAYEALAIMQNANYDFAVVVDEYGLTTGIITIEDLAEEVLGEFYDQLDYKYTDIKQLSEQIYLVKGNTEIEKLQKIGIDIPSGDFETINGFLYTLHKGIPKEGQVIRYKNYEFIILKGEPRYVKEVLIKRVA